jgi:NADH-quinone oxidoreductase subunit J
MAVEILLIVGPGNFGLDAFPKPEPLGGGQQYP